MTTNLSKGGSRWPTGTDYARAIQHAETAFSDVLLKASSVATNTMGMPLVASGQNAVVFLLRAQGNDQAVRCFTTPPTDGSRRYQALTSHLATSPPTAMTAARWLDDGIRVDDNPWPVVVMPWVEGKPFNLVVEDLADDHAALGRMADAWVGMVVELQAADVTHGDLQHGNVLVRDDGKFCLVDLDGSWVPTMPVGAPDETGHPNYQHPRRSTAQWARYGDSFSALLVETGLRALAADSSLERFLTGENVIFNRQDLLDTNRELWTALEGSPDAEVVRLVGVLKARTANHPDTSMLPFTELRSGQIAAPSLPTFGAVGSSLPSLGGTAKATDNSWWQGSAGGAPSVLTPLSGLPLAGSTASPTTAAAATAPVTPLITAAPIANVERPNPAVVSTASGAATTAAPTSTGKRGIGALLGRDAATAGAIGGGIAALLGSVIAGIINLRLPDTARTAVFIALVPMLIGAFVVSWQAIVVGAYPAARRRSAIGGGLGAAAGLVALLPANVIYQGADRVTNLVKIPGTTLSQLFFYQNPLRSAFAWMIVAALVGVLVGALNGLKASFAAGLGGAVAGFLGGLLFGAKVAEFQGHQLLVRGLDPSTIVIVTAIGVVIGFAVGATTKAVSRGRLIIIEGRHQGMETLLPAKRGTIGSASKNTLVLVGDNAVAANHVAIDLTGAHPNLIVDAAQDPIRVNGIETKKAELKDGDVLTIGASFVRFEWKGSDA